MSLPRAENTAFGDSISEQDSLLHQNLDSGDRETKEEVMCLYGTTTEWEKLQDSADLDLQATEKIVA